MPGLPELSIRFAKTIVSYRRVLLATTVVSAIGLPQIVKAFDDTSSSGRIILAQQKEDPKKKKDAPPTKAPPPVQKSVTPPQQPKSVPQPKQVTPPTPPTQPKVQQTTPQPKLAPKQVEQPKPKFVPKSVEQPKLAPKSVEQPKLAPKSVEQPKFAPKSVDQPKLAPKTVDQPKFAPKSVDQPKLAPKTVDQPKLAPTQDPKFGPKQTVQPKTTQPPIQPQTFGKPRVTPANQVGNVNELKGKRKEERVGNQIIIVEPGNRRLIRENNRLVIRHDEGERMRRWGNARFETRGQERYTVVNRGGYEIVTITDSRGHLLRRYRRFPDGREYGLIDNRRRFGVGAAAVAVGGVVLLGLAAPRILIPRDRYVVDMGSAPPTYLYEALEAPPLVPMERAYSLDEIRDNVELRDRVRSVDINTINFSTRLVGGLTRPDPAIAGARGRDAESHRGKPVDGVHDRGSHRRRRLGGRQPVALRPPRRSGGGNPDHELQYPAGESGDAGLWRAAPARRDRRAQPREPAGAGAQHHRADGRRRRTTRRSRGRSARRTARRSASGLSAVIIDAK